MNTAKHKPQKKSPLPPNDPFLPELVLRLEEMVKFSLECEGKPLKDDVSFVNVYKQLMEIRKAIEILTKEQQATLSLIEQSVDMEKAKPAQTDKNTRKMMEKIHHLKQVCDSAKERIHESIREHPSEEAELKEKLRHATSSNQKKVLRRKGKFRKVGGKKGWMPT